MNTDKPRLTHLEIHNFRGIWHLNLPLEQRGWVLLIGENGTGKSSVVDALQYAFHGSLDHLKRQDVKEQTSLQFRSVSEDKGKTIVTLRWRVPGQENAVWSVPYPYTEPEAPPESIAHVVAICRARPFILRRSQILDFVNAKRSERHKKIAELLALDELEAIEQAWRQVQNDLQKEVRAAEQKVEALNKRIRQQMQQANAQLQTLGEQSLKDLCEIPQVIERLTKLQKETQWQAQRKIEKLQEEVAALDELRQTGETLARETQAWLENVRDFQKQVHEEAHMLLIRLLEYSEKLLQETQPGVCPLCGQPINAKAVLAHVQERHQRFSKIRDQQEALRREKERLQNQGTALRTRVQAASIGSATEVLQQLAQGATNLRRTLQPEVSALQPEPIEEAVATLCQSLEVLESIRQTQQKELAKTRSCMKGRGEEKELQDTLYTLRQLQTLEQQWLEAKNNHQQQTQKLGQVKTVLEVFSKSRQRYLDAVFQQIEARVNAYWEAMHPHEQVQVQLRTATKKGVQLNSTMKVAEEEKEGHPLTFLSEGHLDTLGLAIFLAFTKEFNQDLPLLVLDDVLTTVDQSHRQRVAELLAREFSDWHLILTTHDRLWAQQLATTGRAYGIPVRTYHMRPWDPRFGAAIDEWVEEPWDFYREVAERMPALAIAGAGRELEKFLNLMRGLLGLSIPATPGDRYTIGELWDGFKKWVRKHWPESIEGREKDKLLEHLQRVESLWRMRNWSGAHYNEWADTVTGSEALDLIEAIESLVEQFRCPECKAFLRYDRTARAIMCDKRRAEHLSLASR